jgi:hypothetical protein
MDLELSKARETLNTKFIEKAERYDNVVVRVKALT